MIGRLSEGLSGRPCLICRGPASHFQFRPPEDVVLKIVWVVGSVIVAYGVVSSLLHFAWFPERTPPAEDRPHGHRRHVKRRICVVVHDACPREALDVRDDVVAEHEALGLVPVIRKPR